MAGSIWWRWSFGYRKSAEKNTAGGKIFLLVYYLSLHCWSICVFLCMFLGLYNYYGNYCSILYEDSFPILCRL
jgi:hypothetical protein